MVLKNGKLPPSETQDIIGVTEKTVYIPSVNQTNNMDNLTESESLEQDGVLVVNISANNILNFNELYPNIQISNATNKMDEVTNKIQSNSREITGDGNNNLKFKDLPENFTVGPSPTNGVIVTNDNDDIIKVGNINNENKEVDSKLYEGKENKGLDSKLYEEIDLLKPTESLQTLTEEISNRRKRRRRRHGNGRRYDFFIDSLMTLVFLAPDCNVFLCMIALQ